MKRAIFVNRFYAPDHSATAQILTDLTTQLDLDSVAVHVIASRLNYSDPSCSYPRQEMLQEIRVHRVYTTSFGRVSSVGRAIDYLSFYLACAIKLMSLARSGDVVIAKTDPPLISVIACVISYIKGATLINWLQDLFPEVAKAYGLRIARGLPYRLLCSLRNWSLQRASINVVLGSAMRQKLVEAGIDSSQLHVIPNWNIAKTNDKCETTPDQLRTNWNLKGRFVAGYSGNLGKAHDWQTISQAIRALESNERIQFLMVGGGSGMDQLKEEAQQWKLTNLQLRDYQPIELLEQSLSVPNVHLITQSPEMEGLVFPSKFYGVLSVTKPIIFVGDTQSELASIISDNELGFVIQSGDSGSLVNVITTLFENPELLARLSHNVAAYYQSTAKPSVSIASWNSLLMRALRKKAEPSKSEVSINP